MSADKPADATILRCDRQGTIVEVVRDDLGLTARAGLGTAFGDLFPQVSCSLAWRFLLAVVVERAASGWQIPDAIAESGITLSFAGSAGIDGLLVVAATDPADALALRDELSAVEVPATATSRTLGWDPTAAFEAIAPSSPDVRLLSDFVRLNNELANAQRQLARQHAELARLLGKVETLSTTDELTGIPNRRGFFAAVQREFDAAIESGSQLSFAMIDVDHFKRINDAHGHQIGDRVLIALARKLRSALRQHDLIGRYGGDEFAALFPDCGPAGARQVADRLQTAARQVAIDTGTGTVGVTITVGFASLDSQCGTLDNLLARADQSLYRAKVAGRDRVDFWNTPGA